VTDARLLVPASVAWGGAAVTTVVLAAVPDLAERHLWTVRCLVAVAVALVGLAIAAAWVRIRPSWAIAVASLLVGIGSAGVHAAALDPAPVRDWVASRATAMVHGVVVGEPSIRRRADAAVWQQSSYREVRLATTSVAARGGWAAVEIPMLVRLPESVDIPPPGSRVDVLGRLSPSLGSADVAAVLTGDAQPGHLIVTGGPGWVDAWAHSMRSGLHASLVGTPPDAGALVAGLSIGDESGQSPVLRNQMRTSGLSHLTAVSGGNVAIVVISVTMLVALLRLPLVLRIVSALGALAFFVVLVGPSPSVVRAAAMGGLVLVGSLSGGRRAGPSVLAAAVIALVILAPGLTATWGFALSAFATAGLILISPRIIDRLRRWRRTARWPPAAQEALGVTMAAQLATAPLLVTMGASVGWVSLPANLLAMPVVAPITVLGLLAASHR
jgi:competence protein ComEC